MTILDGKALAAKRKGELKEKVSGLARKPGLAVILVGDDPASRTYVNGKKKDCAECGFYSEEYTMPAGVSQAELLELIGQLNQRADIDGILVQLPLPEGLDAIALLDAIVPDKDVDCFHPVNVGKLYTGQKGGFLPCTPGGVMELLHEYGIQVAGKECVVLGRSNIVGKPMAALLLAENGTVTVCHSKTADMAKKCAAADILVSAVGKTGLVTGDMVKEGAVVVDVAMNRNAEGKLCGDVDFDAVAEKCSYITPVPGGVGPMTRAVLMENTYRSCLRHLGLEE